MLKLLKMLQKNFKFKEKLTVASPTSEMKSSPDLKKNDTKSSTSLLF